MARKRFAAVLGLGLFGLASTAPAALIVAVDHQEGPPTPTVPFQPTYTIPFNLLSTSTSSGGAGNFLQEASGGIPVLTDGIFGPVNTGTMGSHPGFATTGGANGGTTLTYTFPTSALGYNVKTIQLFAGWNDSGRDEQRYSVSYTTATNSVFMPLLLTGATISGSVTTGVTPDADITGASFHYNPVIAASTQTANRSVISDSAGANILSNVTAVRFDFGVVENAYTGTAELVVTGAAVPVPEPASLGVLAVGALGLVARRRRQPTA